MLWKSKTLNCDSDQYCFDFTHITQVKRLNQFKTLFKKYKGGKFSLNLWEPLWVKTIKTDAWCFLYPFLKCSISRHATFNKYGKTNPRMSRGQLVLCRAQSWGGHNHMFWAQESGLCQRAMFPQQPQQVCGTATGRTMWVTVGCTIPEPRDGLGDQVGRWVAELSNAYSIFCCSFFWKQTGRIESMARTPSTIREFQDTASPAVVSLYSVVPALIATKDGGATPDNQR